MLDNLLLTILASTADFSRVILASATEIRTCFPPDAVPGIFNAYQYNLRVFYAIVIAYAGAAVFVDVVSKREKLKLKS